MRFHPDVGRQVELCAWTGRGAEPEMQIEEIDPIDEPHPRR
jgi:hypothetical protein